MVGSGISTLIIYRGINMAKPYGKELILDLHNCDPNTFTRESIENYLSKLCKLIKMEGEDLHFWDYLYDDKEYQKAPDHLKGTTVVQFLKTSNVTIHTLDVLEKVFVNIFSCKDFDRMKAQRFTESWFKGETVQWKLINRL